MHKICMGAINLYRLSIGVIIWIILIFPFKKCRAATLSGAIGVLSLLLLNTFTPFLIHINLYTLFVSFVLGLPGTTALYLLKLTALL